MSVTQNIAGYVLVNKFSESQKLYAGFRLHRGWTALTPVLFKGQVNVKKNEVQLNNTDSSLKWGKEKKASDS